MNSWKTTKIKCSGCSKDFLPQRIPRVRKNGNFCSRDCFLKTGLLEKAARAENMANPRTPTWIKRPWDGKTRPDFTGSKHPMFGKKHSEETRKKISEKAKAQWDSGVFDTPEHKIKRRVCQYEPSKKKPNYKGGISGLNNQIRHCEPYRTWKINVFKRDGHTCQICGKKPRWIEAHHKIQFFKIMSKNQIKTLDQAFACDELWDVTNGLTVCKPCHNSIPHERY